MGNAQSRHADGFPNRNQLYHVHGTTAARDCCVFVLIFSVVLLSGFAAFVFGWRGRPIDNRPRCRFCGYDLGGSPDDSKICPECGSNLSRPGAIRAGRHAARPVLLSIGFVLLILAAAISGAWVWGRVTRFNWYTVTPTWMLVGQALADGDDNPSPAMDELVARLAAGKLAGASASFVVDRALREQADSHGEWFGKWDAVFESAWNAGQVDDEQVMAFVENLMSGWHLDHLAEIRMGEPFAITERVDDFKALPSTAIFMRRSITRMSIDGQTVCAYGPVSEADFLQIGMPRTGRAGLNQDIRTNLCSAPDLPPAPPGFSPGEYTTDKELEVNWSVWIQIPGSPTPRNLRVDGQRKRGIRFVDRDRTVVTLKSPEELASAMRDAISFRPLTVYFDSDTGHPWCAADVRSLPMNLGCDVFFVIDGEEYLAGVLAVKADNRGAESFGGREYRIPEFDASQITVVLRPNPAVVEHRMTIFPSEAWGGEMTFENVPISKVDRRPKPVTGSPDQ